MYNPDEYAKSLLPKKQGGVYTNRTEFPKGFFQKERPEATEESYEFNPKTCVPFDWNEDVVIKKNNRKF